MREDQLLDIFEYGKTFEELFIGDCYFYSSFQSDSFAGQYLDSKE